MTRAGRLLRGLVVEDLSDEADEIQQALGIELDRLGWPVGWTRKKSALKGRNVVRSEDPFDFAVVDLKLAEGRQDGLTVVQELRKRDERTYVLLLTSHPEHNALFQEQALRAGATKAILRGQLHDASREMTYATLAEEICTHLVRHEVILEGIMQYQDTDLAMLSLLESLGGHPQHGAVERGLRIVRGLAVRTIRPERVDQAAFDLGYLTPGRSGAQVCRVTMHRPELAPEHFVLKIALDRQALVTERRLNADAVRDLGPSAVIAIEGGVEQDVSGYCAMKARLAENAETLGRWLPGAPPEQARAVARALFVDILARLFHQSLRRPESRASWMSTPAVIGMRVSAALDDHIGALSHEHGGARDDAAEIRNVIEAFVRTGSLDVQVPGRMGESVTYVGGFGDLQSANVLVSQVEHPRPYLVDASRYGVRHWSGDAARLLVDLFLRVREAGVPAMLWDGFGETVSELSNLCWRCAARIEPATPVAAFIAEVVDSLPELLHLDDLGLAADDRHWQWHVALAKELIRQSGHPGLTPPRVAAGLVGAAEHLWTAVRVLDTWER